MTAIADATTIKDPVIEASSSGPGALLVDGFAAILST
jgi:hypothetical protein